MRGACRSLNFSLTLTAFAFGGRTRRPATGGANEKAGSRPAFPQSIRVVSGGLLLVVRVVEFLEVGIHDVAVLGSVGAASPSAASFWAASYMAWPSFIETSASVWLLAWISSASSPSAAVFSAAMASEMAVRSASETLSP